MFSKEFLYRLKEFKKRDEGRVLETILKDMIDSSKKAIISDAVNDNMEHLTKCRNELIILNKLYNKIYTGG